MPVNKSLQSPIPANAHTHTPATGLNYGSSEMVVDENDDDDDDHDNGQRRQRPNVLIGNRFSIKLFYCCYSGPARPWANPLAARTHAHAVFYAPPMSKRKRAFVCECLCGRFSRENKMSPHAILIRDSPIAHERGRGYFPRRHLLALRMCGGEGGVGAICVRLMYQVRRIRG